MISFNSRAAISILVLSWAAFSRASATPQVATNNIPEEFATATLRVLATIPDSCQTVCDGVVDTLTTKCATFECICTSTTTTDIHTCVNCLIGAKTGNETVINEAQGILNQYASICNDGGISVPVQTASGFTGVVSTPTAPLGGQTGAGVPPVSSIFGGGLTTTGGTSLGATATGSAGSNSNTSPTTQVSGTGTGTIGTSTGISSGSTGTGTAPPNHASRSGGNLWFGGLIGLGVVVGNAFF